MSGFSRVIGSWKMSPRSGPRSRLSSLSRLADEVHAVVGDHSVRDRALGQQSEDAAAERRLPAARFTDEADDLARCDVERDAVDRPDRATGGSVVDAKIAHRDDWRVGHCVSPSASNRRGARPLIVGRRREHRIDRLVQALAEQGEAGDEQNDREAGEERRPPDSGRRRRRRRAGCRSPIPRPPSAGSRSRGTRAPRA